MTTGRINQVSLFPLNNTPSIRREKSALSSRIQSGLKYYAPCLCCAQARAFEMNLSLNFSFLKGEEKGKRYFHFITLELLGMRHPCHLSWHIPNTIGYLKKRMGVHAPPLRCCSRRELEFLQNYIH